MCKIKGGKLVKLGAINLAELKGIGVMKIIHQGICPGKLKNHDHSHFDFASNFPSSMERSKSGICY